jgi:hypothetical protein
MAMRSMMTFLNLIVDNEITTREQAAALVEQEAQVMAEFYQITQEEAKEKLLANIQEVTRYLSHKKAADVRELFGIEHPPQPKGDYDDTPGKI